MATQKRVPMRMCVACQEMRPKIELIRVVKNKENQIFIDPTGRKNGRGAYICKNINCFESVKKTRKFERVFGQQVNEDVYDLLIKYM